MADPVDQEQRLLDLSVALAALIEKSIVESLQRMLASPAMRNLDDLLEAGRFGEAMNLTDDLFSGVSRAWSDVMVRAADSTADFLRRVGITIDFNRVNERAVQAMRENQLRLVGELLESQRTAIREVIVDSITRGLNPKEAARRIRGSIGLTRRQVEAVNNYRRLLEQGDSDALDRALRDRRFDSSVRAGRLTPSQIARMVDRYRERQIAHRAREIALTESLSATHAGAQEMYRQALETGVLTDADLERTWRTAGDARVRDAHVSMNGQRRTGLETPFVSANGTLLRFPHDPRAPASERIGCRCGVAVRLHAIG